MKAKLLSKVHFIDCCFCANFCQTQVSGSMQGEKIRQLQDAMFTILDDMTEDDYFSILTFNYDVQVGFDFSRYIHSQ